MAIFREPFERFKARLKNNQKQKSIWKITRWSVHDYERFECLISNIRDIVDALESITSALGVLEKQQTMLVDEIESLSDTQSLGLLQEVGSSRHAPAALQAVSETASLRLSIVTSSSRSYHTALTEQSLGSFRSGQRSLPVRSATLAERASGNRGILDESEAGGQGTQHEDRILWREKDPVDESLDVPQNQRWIAELLKRRQPANEVFTAPKGKYSDYGKALRTIKQADEEAYRSSSLKLVSQADEGQTLAQ